jgi:hypothetical protein
MELHLLLDVAKRFSPQILDVHGDGGAAVWVKNGSQVESCPTFWFTNPSALHSLQWFCMWKRRKDQKDARDRRIRDTMMRQF